MLAVWAHVTINCDTETASTLSDKDTKHVRREIYDARTKWYDIGIELRYQLVP